MEVGWGGGTGAVKLKVASNWKYPVHPANSAGLRYQSRITRDHDAQACRRKDRQVGVTVPDIIEGSAPSEFKDRRDLFPSLRISTGTAGEAGVEEVKMAHDDLREGAGSGGGENETTPGVMFLAQPVDHGNSPGKFPGARHEPAR